MMNQLLIVLLIAASVGSGLAGGLFFIFSNTIMSAFDRMPPAAAVAAMNSINRVILNAVFFLAFFGTGILGVVLMFLSVSRPEGFDVLLASGAVLYFAGSIGVTMVFNVPLNNRLAAVPPTANDLADKWTAYRGPWTRWNHVRTVACLLAAAAFALSASQ